MSQMPGKQAGIDFKYLQDNHLSAGYNVTRLSSGFVISAPRDGVAHIDAWGTGVLIFRLAWSSRYVWELGR